MNNMVAREHQGVFFVTPSRTPLLIVALAIGVLALVTALVLVILIYVFNDPRIESKFSLAPGDVGELGIEIPELSQIRLDINVAWESNPVPLGMSLMTPDEDVILTSESTSPSSDTTFLVDRSSLEQRATGWSLIVRNEGTSGFAEGKLIIRREKLK